MPRGGIRGAALLLAAFVSGCAVPVVGPDAYLHMICVDPNGDAAPLEVEGPASGGDAAAGPTSRRATAIDLHVRDIARRYWTECVELGRDPRDHTIRLVIHGGLVGMQQSVQEAEDALPIMRRGKDRGGVFPVFVNWEAGMGQSYGNHLFSVRGGREEPLWYTIPTAPFLFLIDVGRAVTRFLPVLATNQRSNIQKSYLETAPQSVPHGWEESAWIDTHDQYDGGWITARNVAQEFVPGLARLVTTPLLDLVGYSAYGNMMRRTRVLLLKDGDFDGGHHRPSGALSLLMQHLLGESQQKDEVVGELRRQLQIELAIAAESERGAIQQRLDVANRILNSNEYGHRDEPFANVGEPTFEVIAHSMGTHIANGLVRRYGHTASFRKIVFLGAACSIREFAGQTLPYIVRNEDCTFHNLCLHPFDEIGEWSYGGTMPHGSLLIWIDSYLTEHRSQMDYTLGQWNNVMRALPIIDYLRADVRRRIKVRGFGRRGRYPHSHGALNDVAFGYWKESYYDPEKDLRTRRRVLRQIEEHRGRLSELAAGYAAKLKTMQRDMDRQLAETDSAADVERVHASFVEQAYDQQRQARGRGVPLSVDALLARWREQVKARKADLRAASRPIGSI